MLCVCVFVISIVWGLTAGLYAGGGSVGRTGGEGSIIGG